MRTFLLISCICVFQISQAQSKLNLYPNYNTIGITVLLNTGVSDSAYGNCFYRIKENGNWQPWKTGFELARTTNKQYGGCVFHTTPGKEYMVRTVLKLGQTVVSDLIDSTTTRPEIENKTALRTFYVSPNGSGVSQTRNTPGALNQSLLNQLKAGDHVILLEGEYFTGELNIAQSGTASQPIVLQAENDKVIVNGGFKQPIQWKRAQSDTAHRDYNMFYADLGPINSNCVVVNGKRLYPYRNLMELSYFSTVRIIDNGGSGSGFHGINHDGFFRDGRNSTSSHFPFIDYNPNTYIKFKDKSDTAFKTIQVSQQAWAFSIQSQNYITIKGIHFKYFGAAKQINYRCAIFLNNANNIIVDSCSFDFCDKGIYIRANSNNNTIQHCRFEDDFSKLSYFEFKETGLEYGQLNTYYPNYFPFQARNIEPGRVYFDHLFTGRGNVLRYNLFNGGCDGITCPDTPGDTTRSRHFDIHNNIFGPGSDDAFEVDGNAANIRVWGNEMYGAANGISVSSPCYGPVYIFNNVMRHFRKTVFQYVTNVVVMNTDTIPASPLKLNAAFCDIPGKVYFMHNTVDAGKESYGFVSYQPQSKSSWSKVVSRNNMFYNEGKYYNLWVRAMDSVDFDYNLYYNPNGFTARQDRPNYGEYTTIAGVQSNILGNTNRPGSFIEKHSFVANPKPGWTNSALFDYRLNSSSPAIDKGILINGLNDNFMGTAPDLGAFEFGTNGAHQIHRNGYSFLVYPNPTVSGKIMISGSVTPEKVLVFNANGQLLIEKPCTQQWFELDIESLVAGIYSITLVVDGKYYSQQLLVMP